MKKISPSVKRRAVCPERDNQAPDLNCLTNRDLQRLFQREALKSGEDPDLLAMILIRLKRRSSRTSRIASQFLKHRDVLLVCEAIEALARWKRAEYLEQIWECRTSKHFLVRQAVVEAASYDFEDRSHEKDLKRMLSDRSPLVRQWAAFAYAGLFPEHVSGLYPSLLKNEHFHSVRVGLLTALYDAGQRERLEELLSFLRDRRFLTREVTARTLANEGNIHPQDASSVIQAVNSARRKERVPWMQRLLESVSKKMRASLKIE